MTSIKAYFTKTDVMSVFSGGIDRCTLWLLTPPHFKPLMTECPVFGKIENEDDISPAHWSGDANNSISGRVIRKGNPELLTYIWQQVQNTYLYNTTTDIMRKNERLSEVFHSNIPALDVNDPAAFFKRYDEYDLFRSKHMELPNKSWREWVLELDLDISLLLVK